MLHKAFAEVAKAIGLRKKITPRGMRRTFKDVARAASVADVLGNSRSLSLIGPGGRASTCILRIQLADLILLSDEDWSDDLCPTQRKRYLSAKGPLGNALSMDDYRHNK